MDAKEHFPRMFNYDHWANLECLAALRAAEPPPANILRLLAHTLAAEKLWLERLRIVPQTVVVWPSSTIGECIALSHEMNSLWKEYLASLSIGDFENKVEYRNSKGEPWSSRVEDILTHVLMHSAYHRGQAALEMRAAGLQPANTDFIHGVRQGLVK